MGHIGQVYVDISLVCLLNKYILISLSIHNKNERKLCSDPFNFPDPINFDEHRYFMHHIGVYIKVILRSDV